MKHERTKLAWLMMKLAIESGHENVQIGLQSAQMVKRVVVDSLHQAWIKIGCVHGLRSDR